MHLNKLTVQESFRAIPDEHLSSGRTFHFPKGGRDFVSPRQTLQSVVVLILLPKRIDDSQRQDLNVIERCGSI